jgi:hypothetical protein
LLHGFPHRVKKRTALLRELFRDSKRCSVTSCDCRPIVSTWSRLTCRGSAVPRYPVAKNSLIVSIISPRRSPDSL